MDVYGILMFLLQMASFYLDSSRAVAARVCSVRTMRGFV